MPDAIAGNDPCAGGFQCFICLVGKDAVNADANRCVAGALIKAANRRYHRPSTRNDIVDENRGAAG